MKSMEEQFNEEECIRTLKILSGEIVPLLSFWFPETDDEKADPEYEFL